MEKLCVGLAKKPHNTNYQPRKTTEMLAKTLDTINAAMSIEIGSESTPRNILIEGLKLAVAITMPDLPINSEFADTISIEVLPLIDQLIENSKTLELAKAQVFPKDDKKISAARADLLAVMDVKFYSVRSILQETILKPVQQFNQAVANAAGLSSAAYNAATEDNLFDRTPQLVQLFKNFDKMASLCAELDPSLLPSWLNQANGYFQQFTNSVDAITQATLKGLGAFYNYFNQLAFFIPQSIRYYISHSDTFAQILNIIDKSARDIPYDRVLAYFAFYQLIEQAQLIDHELKANFFESYMAEVVRIDNTLSYEASNFGSYLLLETQLRTKENLDLKLPLTQRIKQYEHDAKAEFSKSVIDATEAQGFSNPQILGALILLNRLQTLEAKFDSKNPQAVFDELTEAVKIISLSLFKELQAIDEKFLQPAIQRVYSQYQNERLIPLLEEVLDKPDPYTNQFTHELYFFYAKLQEKINLSSDDLDSLITYFRKKPQPQDNQNDYLVNELTSVKNLAILLPQNNKSPDKHWRTANELRKLKASQTLENIRPKLLPMFEVLQQRLGEQKKKIAHLEQIELAEKKINYINALNGLINKLKRELENPDLQQYSDLHDYFSQLLSGKINPFDLEQLKNQFISAPSEIPVKLLGFIWHVLPFSPQSSYFYNLLAYSIKDISSFPQLLKAEKEYKYCLNSNPIPALMNELSDPLAVANVIPSQEKIMDAIIANLIESGKQKTFAWGVNYLKQLVESVSYEQLMLFLPYPFFAELAVIALKSQMLQLHVAPMFNSIMSEYGDLVSEELKRIAKERLYPVLGIVVQKTIESCAYAYALDPEKANATERDSFAMLYLQYRELRLRAQSLNNEDAIRFLFPNLLAEMKTQQQEMIKQIANEFKKLDRILPAELTILPVNSEIEGSDQQLQFFIEHIDLNETANRKLIKLALMNRLVIMALDTAEQLSNEDKIDALQIKAIDIFSKMLGNLNQSSQQALLAQDRGVNVGFEDSELLTFPDKKTINKLTETLSDSHKRVVKLQLERVKASLAKSKTLVDNEVKKLESMTKVENLLGLSVLEWKYHNWPTPNKIFSFFSWLGGIIGPISSWVTIITTILTMSVTFSNFVTLALGWTGIGFGIGAALGLLFNLAGNIFEHLAEIKEISEENSSFLSRLGKISLIVLKCFIQALMKTFFIDQIRDGLSSLFAVKPLEDLRDSLRFWPTEKRVRSEIEQLNSLQNQLNQLDRLIEIQINFIENKMNPITQESYADQSMQINTLGNKIGLTMTNTQLFLKSDLENDARITVEDYNQVLESITTHFTSLRDELMRMERLRTAEPNRQMRTEPNIRANDESLVTTIIPQNTNEAKPVLVNLAAYREKLREQPGYFSYFWNRLRANPPQVVEESNTVSAQQEPNPLTISSFYLVEPVSLVDSIIDGISAATPENEDTLINPSEANNPPSPRLGFFANATTGSATVKSAAIPQRINEFV